MVTVLLVEPEPRLARDLIRAIEVDGGVRLHHARTGRAAIDALTHYPVDLCLVADRLPDLTGTDLVIQLHQRRGDLPIIMLSGAKSSATAVAAFRAGVRDYLPKDHHLMSAVVRAVQQLAESGDPADLRTPSIPADMPRELLTLTYQNRLRVIGRQLDLNGYRQVVILAVGGGFLVRALPPAGRVAEVLEFPDRDVLHWMTEAYRRRGGEERDGSRVPLLPSGYEDFLRALGAALDRQQAEAMTIAEYTQMIVVAGLAKVDTSAQTTVGPLEWILQHADILELLDQGYHRRRSSTRALGQRRSPLGRRFGRRDS